MTPLHIRALKTMPFHGTFRDGQPVEGWPQGLDPGALGKVRGWGLVRMVPLEAPNEWRYELTAKGAKALAENKIEI